MKSIFLFFIMLMAAQLVAQKKGKVDKQAQIDSLVQVSARFSVRSDSLFLVLDSVSKERTEYYGVYTAIKDKVLKRDFEPARLPFIIDSLATVRQSTLTQFTDASKVMQDSVAVLKTENAHFKSLLNGINEQEAARNRLVSELKVLKDLLDAQILTAEEFEERKKAVLARWK